jgi:hypothetical protein
VQENITPEERLAAVVNRAAHAQASTVSSSPSDAGADYVKFIKQSDRADDLESGNVKKYLKKVR